MCTDDAARPATSAGRRSWAYFNHYVSSGRAVWDNSITVRSLEYRLDYTAIGVIARVAPTPLLMIVASADDVTPTQIALAAYAQAREPKRLGLIAGHHYRPFIGEFVQSSSAAHDWFLQHL